MSAAKFYRDRVGHDAKILILDNHDDFGGHAKRNEFNVDGKILVGYGGSQTIAGPANYSAVSKQLLIDVGIDVQRFYEFYDQEFFSKRKLSEALYFDKSKYGVDRVLPSRQLHAAPARQRTLYHSRRWGAGEKVAGQHKPHEFLA